MSTNTAGTMGMWVAGGHQSLQNHLRSLARACLGSCECEQASPVGADGFPAVPKSSILLPAASQHLEQGFPRCSEGQGVDFLGVQKVRVSISSGFRRSG